MAALLGSAVTSGRDVRTHVADAVARDSKLTLDERRHAAGNRLGFEAAPFDAFRATLRKGDRYSVDVPPGAKGPFITRGAVVSGSGVLRACSARYRTGAGKLPGEAKSAAPRTTTAAASVARTVTDQPPRRLRSST